MEARKQIEAILGTPVWTSRSPGLARDIQARRTKF